MNSALARLGDARIETNDAGDVDLDDELTQTVVDVYGPVRDALLDKYPWSEATELHRLRTERVAQADASSAGYSRRAVLAYPWIHAIRGVFEVDAASTPAVRGPAIQHEWSARGGYLLTGDHDEVFVELQRGLGEAAQTRLMDEALILQLCADLAVARTFDVPTANLFQKRADRALEIAQRVDAQGQPAATLSSYRLAQARVGAWSRWGDRARSVAE